MGKGKCGASNLVSAYFFGNIDSLSYISFSPIRNPPSSPTKLLCFTRSSPLVHQLPAQYPSSILNVHTTGNVHQTLCELVFPYPSHLVVCKLSSLFTQSSIQELLNMFVRSDTAQVSFSALKDVDMCIPAVCIYLYIYILVSIVFVLQVCLLVVNMQETSRQVVNHVRIMVEEKEMLSTHHTKLIVMLLYFSPAQFFDHCYPSLFLKGWDHYYLDTVEHSACQAVDIRDWLWQCYFSQKMPLSSERDSLVPTLEHILPEAIPILSSRVLFGFRKEMSFNHPMNISQRSEFLRELIFKKGVGRVLCERFYSYWKPAVMAEYLEKAAMFTKNNESTLNITDSVQINFKCLFFDFLVCMLSRINEQFNIDILFDADCTPAVQGLFLDILKVLPLPKLSQLKVLSTSLPVPTPDQGHSPRFPFFKGISKAVERIVKQSYEDANMKLDLLEEKEVESTDSTSFHILQEAAIGRVKKKMEVSY